TMSCLPAVSAVPSPVTTSVYSVLSTRTGLKTSTFGCSPTSPRTVATSATRSEPARSHTAPSNVVDAEHPVRATAARLRVARTADVLRTRSSLFRRLLRFARRGRLPGALRGLLRLAHPLAQILVGDLAIAHGPRRPQFDVLVGVARLRCASLHLGSDRTGREPAGREQEPGVRDHPMVGAHRETLDVPAAHHRLGRLRLGEQPGAADVLRHARELRRRGDVAEHDAARRE